MSPMNNGTNLYESSYEGHIPSLGGNISIFVILVLLTILQIVFGKISKQWCFMTFWLIGFVLEVDSYINRIMYHFETERGQFVSQYVLILIAPCFFLTGIHYICAEAIIIIGTKFLMIRPLLYTILFSVLGCLSLAFQAGGSIAVGLNKSNSHIINTGRIILIIGLSFQLLSMTIFQVLWYHFLFRCYNEYKSNHGLEFNQDYSPFRKQGMFKCTLLAISWSVLCFYLRTIYRVIETSQGVHSELGTNEKYFLTMEAMPVLLATVCLTIFYPGLLYGRYLPLPVSKIFGFEQKEDVASLDEPEHELVEMGTDSSSYNSETLVEVQLEPSPVSIR